jgi:hypothetical protein
MPDTPNESEFVVAGPGALDGISKCFKDFKDYSAEYVINWTVDRPDIEFDRLELKFETLFGRRLQPIDCQNLFCEISKYSRVAHPDVPGIANRHKIKRPYVRDSRPLLPLAFPPQWQLEIPQMFVNPAEKQGRNMAAYRSRALGSRMTTSATCIARSTPVMMSWIIHSWAPTRTRRIIAGSSMRCIGGSRSFISSGLPLVARCAVSCHGIVGPAVIG